MKSHYPPVYYLLLLAALTGCKTPSKSTSGTSIQRSGIHADSTQIKRMYGTDMLATGQIPVTWRLEMDFDKEFRFMTATGDSFVTTSVKPLIDPASLLQTYTVRTSAGQMNIRISADPCPDNGKKVSVDVRNIHYTGCASYMLNKTLGGTWILEKIDDKIIQPDAFPSGLPKIKIDKNVKKISGHTGCNQLNGQIQVEGDRIRFGPLAMTMKACSYMEMENILGKWVSNKLINYRIENNLLLLYLGNDSQLVFRRE